VRLALLGDAELLDGEYVQDEKAQDDTLAQGPRGAARRSQACRAWLWPEPSSVYTQVSAPPLAKWTCHHAVMARPTHPDAHEAILERVRAIPCGFVRTYGDVSPGAPRVAGYVLSRTDARDAPWHRVVRADGSLAKGSRQRRLLEAEGVPFRNERVVLSHARLLDFEGI
jgi:methylated-DNA-protein-cysteine methyltransferase related protein